MDDSSDDEVLSMSALLLYLRKMKSNNVGGVWADNVEVVERENSQPTHHHFVTYILHVYLGLQSNNDKCTDHQFQYLRSLGSIRN